MLELPARGSSSHLWTRSLNTQVSLTHLPRLLLFLSVPLFVVHFSVFIIFLVSLLLLLYFFIIPFFIFISRSPPFRLDSLFCFFLFLPLTFSTRIFFSLFHHSHLSLLFCLSCLHSSFFSIILSLICSYFSLSLSLPQVPQHLSLNPQNKNKNQKQSSCLLSSLRPLPKVHALQETKQKRKTNSPIYKQERHLEVAWSSFSGSSRADNTCKYEGQLSFTILTVSYHLPRPSSHATHIHTLLLKIRKLLSSCVFPSSDTTHTHGPGGERLI